MKENAPYGFIKIIDDTGEALREARSLSNKSVITEWEKKYANGILRFTEKELSKMPKKFKKEFRAGRIVAHVRKKSNGVFEIRCQVQKEKIAVSSKLLDTAKEKFITAINELSQINTANKETTRKINADSVYFKDCVAQWLVVKEKTTKPSTFKEYARQCDRDLVPSFGDMKITEISRDMLQTYLFGFINKGKSGKAEKLQITLDSIFDMVADDYKINSPMSKIVLPYRTPKKGTAFKRDEEKVLIDYCRNNPQRKAVCAILVMLFFGLRFSELITLQVIEELGEKWLQVETSKERMGKDMVLRYIPFTPMAKQFLPYIDFEVARTTKQRTIASTISRLFPNHHPHDLRYTFITNCKQCGVNAELVMLWDGHEEDKDVRASRVDRGYTDFSKEFQLQEAQKVLYIIK